ncbi:LOW QUALITY PROTEIN: ceruloplasmin-like [Dugong dugon]
MARCKKHEFLVNSDAHGSWDHSGESVFQVLSILIIPRACQRKMTTGSQAKNGCMYGNLPGLDICLGDNVSWLFSVGSESDLHGIYFSGNTFTSLGSRMDTITVFPHISQMLSMTPDSTGTFCGVYTTAEHYQGGMKHKYQVRQCLKLNPDQTYYQEVKTIYTAAVEIIWDYSSREWERLLHHLQGKNQTNIYPDRTGTFLGSRYKKVVYRQYDDTTFTHQTKRSENEKHLDDLHSGPIGPLIICRKNAKPSIVHHIVLFMIFDEKRFWYFEENINTYSCDANNIARDDCNFEQSNHTCRNVR